MRTRKASVGLLSTTIFLAALLSLCVASPGYAEDFPSKPIIWIVPMSPGGGFDVYSRGVAKVMEKYLGQPVVIKNMPGAGNRTGTNAIYRARPDGHTIGIINAAGMAAGQMLMDTQFDLNKFTWIGGCAVEKYVLATRADSPYHSVADLQKSKKPINIGVTGKGSTAYTVAIIGLKSLGVPFRFVTGYGGSSDAIVGCIRGDTDLVNFVDTSIYPHVQSGSLRALAAYTKKRDPLFPNTPTCGELGHPDLSALGVPRLIAGPPGIPADRVKILEDALQKALRDPELLAWSKKANRPIEEITGSEAAGMVSGIMETYKTYEGILKSYY